MSSQSSSLSLDPLQPSRQFTISEIQIATRNFDDSLVIGHGGFGKVYRGTITNNGEGILDVAIKRLEATSSQGAVEFWAEIEMLSKLRHCHLVSLIGYCNDGKEMILVYHYMPHGTLEDHLHKRGTPLSWVRRLKICIGAARGLHYLHTGTGIKNGVIHRDVKSSNILLDGSWEAKVSDFGLSKIGPTNQPCTYVSTLVKGTFGYLDPDYVYTGRLTRKSDVYAFGVILFEVLCGKQAVDSSLDEEQWSLAIWAQDSIKEGRLKQIVDTNIRGIISPKCLKEFARLADWCLQSHLKQRPTMAEVVVGLESVLALQEKSNNNLQLAGMPTFRRKAPSVWSVGGRSLKSLDIYLYAVEGENRTLRRFDIDTINVATENFSNLIFGDDFGYIYKGRLKNGQDIAVLERSGSCTDYECDMNEASVLVKVEHKNLVQLLGYCIAGTKVYFLYDFAPYASLHHLISGDSRAPIDWDERYKILLGVAQALAYLHNHAPIRVIHSDVNLHNIFLDESLVPKLSGFWFSRCFKVNEPDYIAVHQGPEIRGFMPPEYILDGCLSTKTDVFSFGALIFEMGFFGAGRQLEEIAWRDWLAGIASNISDADSSKISRCIHIATLCTEADVNDRPNMDAVIAMLLNTSNYHNLPLPKRPMLSWRISDFSYNTKLDDYDVGAVEEFKSELGTVFQIGPTNQACTSVSTLVKGTFGYLDPDYVFTGRLTRKSDVYAFGVVMLEVLCGKQAVDTSLDEEQRGLARWAQDSIKEGMLKQIVDVNLRGRISPKCLKEFAQLADRCLQSHLKQRPTMAEVVMGLESVLALQEKSNSTLQPAGMTIFRRKAPKLIFPSNQEWSVRGISLKSLDMYLYTVGGENQILRRFDFDAINGATKSFSNLISCASHGYLYKGSLQNGQEIAILQRSSFCTDYEYVMNEASTLIKLEHPNVARLLGYCIAETQVFLIYDFAPYANLQELIDDGDRAPLDWDESYKILLGVAQALVYLHKHAPIRVIHSDVDVRNIWLDQSLVPKLSGFWFSKFSKIDEPDYIDVKVFGASRYIAPECSQTGHLSTKVDVFRFGFLILEVVFLHPPISGLVEDGKYLGGEIGLRDWLGSHISHLRDGLGSNISDADLSQISRCIHIGLLCIEEDADERPSMDEVIGMLLNTSLPLPYPPSSKRPSHYHWDAT